MKSAPSHQTGELVALVREGRLAAFIDRAVILPGVELADVLVELPDAERCALVMQLPPRLSAHALVEMPRDAHPEVILRSVGATRAGQMIAELDDDDAASLLGRLAVSEREPILARLADHVALDRLLSHLPGTAGALMTARLIAVSELDPIMLAIETVRRQAAETGDLREVFVIDSARRLVGVLALKQLLLAAPASLVRDGMVRGGVRVRPGEGQETVARVIARYNLASVPVVDEGGRLIGRVTADDVRDIVFDEAAEDLLHFGGVSVRETVNANWSLAVRSRLPWLYANLAPAFGAAAVVFFFKGSLVRVVTLAVWMPVIGGVGGNAGTQALATAVRRLVLHPERPEQMRSLMLREAAVGAANGVAIGAIVAGVAVLLGESWKMGMVVLLAMIANLALAGIAGAALPIVLKRLGRDPALASPVVVTALMDMCGFALLLGLATAVLL